MSPPPEVRPDYALFDHTADFGLEVRAADEASLLAGAALAVSDAMFGLDTLAPCADETFTIDADEPELRLYAVLAEVLFRIDAFGLLPACATVAAGADGQRTVRLRCDRLDPARHQHKVVFKAVTLHGIEVRETDDGRWIGRVILDG